MKDWRIEYCSTWGKVQFPYEWKHRILRSIYMTYVVVPSRNKRILHHSCLFVQKSCRSPTRIPAREYIRCRTYILLVMLDLGHENYSHYCFITCILCYWLRSSNAILVIKMVCKNFHDPQVQHYLHKLPRRSG